MAYDMFYKVSKFNDKYTSEQLESFKSYLDKQIQKIDLDYIDYDFVWDKMLEMYSNTLKNHLEAIQS